MTKVAMINSSMINLAVNALLLALIVISVVSPHAAEASSCDAAENNVVPQLHNAEASPLQYQFDSGATWELCWHMDPQAGLVLSRVFYGAPTEPPRQVLDAASIGQILFKYDEDDVETQLLSETGLGGSEILQTDNSLCEDGELVSGINEQQICRGVRYINPLSKVRRSESTPRHEMTLHAWSRIGTHLYQQLWRLTEDGEIHPSVIFSGQINRYTSDPKFGVRLDDSSRYASSASLLVNWRLDFNINGTPNNDQVDEVEFQLSGPDTQERSINLVNIEAETMRTTERESFRGWRISDSEVTSVDDNSENSGVGYYLDPQSSGHRYVSPNHNWSRFDFFVTERHPCEQLSSGNDLINDGCSAELDSYVNNQSITNSDIVVWYSVSRHFTPRREDFPAITATELSFSVLPFDWSSQSRFSPDIEVVVDTPMAQ